MGVESGSEPIRAQMRVEGGKCTWRRVVASPSSEARPSLGTDRKGQGEQGATKIGNNSQDRTSPRMGVSEPPPP